MGPRGSRPRPVYRITAAQRGLSEELRGRTRRYLWSMGIRTACLLGAIVASGTLRWVLVVGALLLPWVAVVSANAGRERDKDDPPAAVAVPDRRLLGGGDAPADPTGSGDAPG